MESQSENETSETLEELSEDAGDGSGEAAQAGTEQSEDSSVATEVAAEIPKTVKISGGLVLDVPPLDDEQAELVTTPVEEIPETKIFVPVPLVARLTTGVPNVKKLVLKQRELVK